jgi:hypothetical protein
VVERAWLVAVLTIVSSVTWSAGPAMAHFCASPESIEPGRQATVTVAVAAEARVVEVVVEIPRGFRVDDVLETGRWRSARGSRTVRFSGGEIEADSCESFRLVGTARAEGTIVFPVTVTDDAGTSRRYTDRDRGAEYAAQVVHVLAGAKAGSDGGLYGSVSLPVLVPGAALVALALVAGRLGRRQVASLLLVGGIGLVVVAVLVAGEQDDERVDIDVVSPRDGAAVDAGSIDVRVRVDGPLATGPADRSGGHLHLFVDGEVQPMTYADRSELTVVPGRHRITVEYVDSRHRSYEPPVEETVVVVAE